MDRRRVEAQTLRGLHGRGRGRIGRRIFEARFEGREPDDEIAGHVRELPAERGG
jgi:hypothetical protein